MRNIHYLVFMILCCLGCEEQQKSTGPRVRKVECRQVKAKEMQMSIKATGTTQPATTVDLAFRISGVIKNTHVARGDMVKEKQLLATLEPQDFQLQKQRAQENLNIATSNLVRIKAEARPEELKVAKFRLKAAAKSYDFAKRYYEKQIELGRSSILSSLDLERYKTDAEVAFENVQIAQKELQLVEKGAREEDIIAVSHKVALAEVEVDIAAQNLKYLQIFSPIRGVISYYGIETGEYAVPAKRVVTVEDFYQVKLSVSVPETQILEVKKGLTVNVDIPSVGKSVKGKISYVAANADVIAKTFQVEILIPNKDLSIRGGMFATAHIDVEKPTTGIFIPPQCIQHDAAGDYVFLVSDDIKNPRIIRRNIKMGDLSDNLVQVENGLFVDDWLVHVGHHYVSENELVVAIRKQEEN
ncbi:efflux RND transporter periplasmic adaptor subunit [Candidatus Uabimicrobium amorphum]|uniref:Secretion protein HlyD n=1 Tax=Uabimicrobium amorphum TaxID=2596890 RepID=A0A5S9ISK4_UABAM|nr:efflux RND transporter periplasmic adaptor subunit [Candidatus Uabimicrobium amorphum]BBM87378.1 secretion protein HlyD [Candidatus Uabimicrobium amorphum]